MVGGSVGKGGERVTSRPVCWQGVYLQGVVAIMSSPGDFRLEFDQCDHGVGGDRGGQNGVGLAAGP